MGIAIEDIKHCLLCMIDCEVCEECNLYGTTGTDHCEHDCVDGALNIINTYERLRDNYNERLKADMIAMLTEIQVQAEETIENIYEPCSDDVLQMCQHNAFADCFEQYNDLIQEKINALKENEDG